jgi:hypothetical protein
MDLYERVEKRRFLGREFLLHLWFETELLSATLSTRATGPFGLWIEKELSLSAGKETTRIKGSLPAQAREAKESLLLGKTPERAGFRLVKGEREASFVLVGDTLALAAVALAAALAEEAPERDALDAAPAARPRRPRERSVEAELEQAEVAAQESFFERMHLLREVEELVEHLYAEFLALRLGPAYAAFVAPALRAWALGEALDADAYAAKKKAALTPPRGKRSSG